MAYDEKLARRMRDELKGIPFVEKKMFGGVGFLLHGNMACGVYKENMIVRVDPAKHVSLLKKPGARPFDITGRPMKGWVMVEPDGLDTVINATAVATSRGSEIRMSMRLREVKPPPSGFPRRECPPPTAVRRGLDKIWAAVDQAMEVKPASR